MDRLHKLEILVKEKLYNEPTGHDYFHALRVVNNAKVLMDDMDVNKDVILVSCWCHDLIDDKLDNKYKISQTDLNDFLKNIGYKKDDINHVIDIINNMSFRKNKVLSSTEGKLVQDADRLDALGAIGIARTFSFGGNHNRRILDDENNQESSVGHFYDKLLKLTDLMNTKNAKKEATKRTEFMLEYLHQLKQETGINKFRD